MRWGLVPQWSKGPDNRFSMINARSETVETKPAYRGPFRYRRCVLPADGFYEWKAMSPSISKGGPKQPFLLRRPGGGPFFMAGVWDRWLGGDGSEIDSVSIITRPATPAIQDIHDRMPLILDVDRSHDWISGEGGIKSLRSLLEGGDIALERVAVSRMINDPRRDEPACLMPVEEDQ
jgi:putative SOS response-associated peptidase YedK